MYVIGKIVLDEWTGIPACDFRLSLTHCVNWMLLALLPSHTYDMLTCNP